MTQVTRGALIAANGINLSTVLKKFATSGKADLKDSTVLADTGAKKFQKGLVERDFAAEGFFKASDVTAEDADGMLRAAFEDVSGDCLVLAGREGSSVGAPCEMFNLRMAKYDVETVVGELISAAIDGKMSKSTADWQAGVFLFSQAVTEETNGTSYDNGASATGYVIQIQVLATGAGNENAAVTIQHSSNNATWADLVAAAGYEENTSVILVSTAASVNRYVRAVVEPSDVSATVAIGIKIGYSG